MAWIIRLPYLLPFQTTGSIVIALPAATDTTEEGRVSASGLVLPTPLLADAAPALVAAAPARSINNTSVLLSSFLTIPITYPFPVCASRETVSIIH